MSGGGGSAPQTTTTDGGTTTEVHYPAYMEAIHEHWIDDIGWSGNTNTNLIGRAKNFNPYKSAEVYDPTDNLDNMQAAFSSFDALVQSYVPDSVIQACIDIAIDNFEELIGRTSKGTAAAKASFEEGSADRWARALARLNLGAFDVNAVQTSTYVVARALLERSHQKELERFDSSLDLQTNAAANSMISNIIQLALQAQNMQRDLHGRKAAAKSELERLSIVANTEYLVRDLDIDVKSLVFPLTLYQYGSNVLAGMAGATTSTTNSQGLTFTEQGIAKGSAFSSMLVGAGAGAIAGAPIAPPWGAVAGGLIGGVAGLAQS